MTINRILEAIRKSQNKVANYLKAKLILPRFYKWLKNDYGLK